MIPTSALMRWSALGIALYLLALAVITHISVARKKKEIVQRAKAAGAGLSEEETKQIEELDKSRDKTFRTVVMGVVAMLLITMTEWGGRA